MKLGIVVILALVLIGSLAFLYIRHVRKREDAVAAFALSEIDRQYEACRKPYQTEDCKRFPAACVIPLDGCSERKSAAEQEWVLKYPTQAAQRQADMLEEKRRQDEKNMQRQQ